MNYYDNFFEIEKKILKDKISERNRMAKIDEQTLVEHLSEFRKRLIITIIFFIAAFLVSLLFCSDIYKLLTASFKQKLTVLGPNDILSIYFDIAFYKLSNMGFYSSCS